MDFRTLVINWHKQTIDYRDYFAKFTFEYLAFIAYLKRFKYLQGDDRTTINELKSDRFIKDEYRRAIKKDATLQRTWGALIDELQSDPLKNVSKPDQLERHWAGPRPGVIRTIDDWDNIIEFWYTVRNNLFHGDKDPEKKRDMDIAEYAYKTLRPLVTIFVSKLSESII